jgi:hypothetical protein
MGNKLRYHLFGSVKGPYFPRSFGMLKIAFKDEYRERECTQTYLNHDAQKANHGTAIAILSLFGHELIRSLVIIGF